MRRGRQCLSGRMAVVSVSKINKSLRKTGKRRGAFMLIFFNYAFCFRLSFSVSNFSLYLCIRFMQ